MAISKKYQKILGSRFCMRGLRKEGGGGFLEKIGWWWGAQGKRMLYPQRVCSLGEDPYRVPFPLTQ